MKLEDRPQQFFGLIPGAPFQQYLREPIPGGCDDALMRFGFGDDLSILLLCSFQVSVGRFREKGIL